MIELKNIVKKFNNEEVLKNISLKVGYKERVVMIGHSGAGKSSLLRTMNLLEVPNSGEVYFEGKRISKLDINCHNDLTLSPKELKIFETKTAGNLNLARAKMGMVFQQFNLFNNLKVIENLILSPVHLKLLTTHAAIRKALGLLDKIGLLEKKDSYPNRLSGGQKQRVAIARALMNDPKVLLFDEPTSSLDPRMVGEVLDLIKQLAEGGTTMVCVTHEMKFAKDIATRVIFLKDGRIVEEGANLFNEPKTPELKEFLRL